MKAISHKKLNRIKQIIRDIDNHPNDSVLFILKTSYSLYTKCRGITAEEVEHLDLWFNKNYQDDAVRQLLKNIIAACRSI